MKKIIIGILSGIASSLISKGGETFPWGGFLILWAVLFVMITLLWNKIVEHKITAVLSAIAAICLSMSDTLGLEGMDMWIIPMTWIILFLIARGVIYGLQCEGILKSKTPRPQTFRRRFMANIEDSVSSAVTDFMMGKPETPEQRKERQEREARQIQAQKDYDFHTWRAKETAGTPEAEYHKNMANDARNRM